MRADNRLKGKGGREQIIWGRRVVSSVGEGEMEKRILYRRP
jgi:hypothetical protein